MMQVMKLEPPALVLALLVVAHTSSPQASSAPVLDLKNPETAQRLTQMFERDQAQAINNFYEQKALRAMTSVSNHSHDEPTTKFIPLSLLDPKAPKAPAGFTRYLVVQSLPNRAANRTSATRGETDEQVLPGAPTNGTHDHLKSDARQSSLFGGFPSGPFGNNYGSQGPFGNNYGSPGPFGNGLLRPPSMPQLPSLSAFPTLPPFGPFGQQATRAPKLAVIGNGGGPMALTNDNVVVVNVLSGNY